jgi:spore maturation protein CgeB
MNIVMLGLSITSAWGNGHATTYRALVGGLAARGHDVLFLERDAHWYAKNRDLPKPPYCRVGIYQQLDELQRTYSNAIEQADLVMLGSYVPDGTAVADLVLQTAGGCTAFYDIDTPVTLRALEKDVAQYLAQRQVPEFDLYLSFTGGPTLQRLERDLGAKRARALYCSADTDAYVMDPAARKEFDLGYLGTFSTDRQPVVDELLIAPARQWREGRFVMAGAQYPSSVTTSANVERVVHINPSHHSHFYNRLRFTLNVTRRDMVEAGFSPSVRLFEAAACGTAIISDDWPGLSTLLTPGREILIAQDAREVLSYLRDLPDDERGRIGMRARTRILDSHTSRHRAIELEQYVAEALGSDASTTTTGTAATEKLA